MPFKSTQCNRDAKTMNKNDTFIGNSINVMALLRLPIFKLPILHIKLGELPRPLTSDCNGSISFQA